MKLNFVSLDNQDVEIELGLFSSGRVGLTSVVKLTVDGKKTDFKSFISGVELLKKGVNCSSSSIGFSDNIVLTHKDSKAFNQAFSAFMGEVLSSGLVENPALKNKSYLASFDARFYDLLSIFVLSMKSTSTTAIACGIDTLLSMEEIIFIEQCLGSSPYLKSLKQTAIGVGDFVIALKSAYVEVMKNRNGLKSLMDLTHPSCSFDYNEFPQNQLIDDLPL